MTLEESLKASVPHYSLFLGGTIPLTLGWVENGAVFDTVTVGRAHIGQAGLTVFTIGLFSGMTAVSLMG